MSRTPHRPHPHSGDSGSPRPEERWSRAGQLAHRLTRFPQPKIQAPHQEVRDQSKVRRAPSKRVLIIDDDEFGRQTLSSILDAVGFGVEQAAGGAEALQRLTRPPLPDLILLDLIMPEVDGWQVIDRLAKEPRLAAIPLIVVTADDSGVILTGTAPVVGQFKKPLNVDALLALMRRHAGLS